MFTGDTLFIGDVGRPDLIGSKGYTAEQMAGMLFDSLHDKLLPLPDDVEVYPAHGAGSLCGRNMSRETMSTMGEQRKLNHAVQPMARDAFIAMMTTDLPECPGYFATDAEINRTGASALGELAESVPLEPAAVRTLQQAGHLVLDVRPAGAFGTGHVPGSLSIGLGGQFASWAGNLIRAGTPIVVVAEDESGAGEAVTRLARVDVGSSGAPRCDPSPDARGRIEGSNGRGRPLAGDRCAPRSRVSGRACPDRGVRAPGRPGGRT